MWHHWVCHSLGRFWGLSSSPSSLQRNHFTDWHLPSLEKSFLSFLPSFFYFFLSFISSRSILYIILVAVKHKDKFHCLKWPLSFRLVDLASHLVLRLEHTEIQGCRQLPSLLAHHPFLPLLWRDPYAEGLYNIAFVKQKAFAFMCTKMADSIWTWY